MSIIIKKKPKYNKKRLIQRAIILVVIYFTSFFSLYAIFGEKDVPEKISEQSEVITYKNDGEKFLAEEKYFNAIEFYKTILTKNSEDFVSMTKLALAYKNIQDYEKAKFYTYKSKELAPYYPENYIVAADIYIDQKDYITAEKVINLLPAKTKEHFLSKANVLVKLANAEDNIEDKILHYNSALKYYKKYDKVSYEEKVNYLVELYFDLINFYKNKNDVDAAVLHYNKIKKLKDDCITNIRLAKTFLGISTLHSVKALTKATKEADTQSEKRLTKETIINFKYYFETVGENDLIQLMKTLLDLLDETTILVNEKFMPYQVKEDNFTLILENKKTYPQVNFVVFNNSEKNISSLYAKTEVYIHSSKILDSNIKKIISNDISIEPSASSNLISLTSEMALDNSKINLYTITLSLSENRKDWFLYRIYKSK